ncbi:MAG: phytanoyl-CoA dioxygenase family protein [Actinobacteria bacterium]|nr:phytanoyl-CoA dioxygenase family protein [Actinomycetota bacterium]
MSAATTSIADRELAQRGYTRLGRVLDDATVADLRAELDGFVPDAVPDGPYGVLRHDPWRRLPAFAAVLGASSVAEAPRRVLGVDRVVLFQDHVVWKPPGTREEVRWHQDRSYWPLDAPLGVTLWIALDDADEDNGCLRYVVGTHLLGERRPADFVPGADRGGERSSSGAVAQPERSSSGAVAQPERSSSGAVAQPERSSSGAVAQPHEALPTIDIAGREADIESAPCGAGEGLAHDPWVWHASPPNRSHRHRRAWSLSFVTPEARWAPDRAPHPYLYQLDPAPGAPLDPARFPHYSEV